MIDYGRQMDLEELSVAIKQARNSDERNYYNKMAYGIINQSTTITSLRQELIGAFRAKDTSKVKRLQLHIQRVRLEETRGNSWGSNKGNRYG